MNACHCKDFTRAAVMRQAAAQAARSRQRPAGDRARHADARGHRPLAPLVPRALQRARARRVRRRRARAARVRRGRSPTRWAPRARTRCSSRSSSTAASTRSRCSRRSATPPTRRCARRSRWRRTPAFAFRDDPRLQWHSAAAPAQGAARGGQAHRRARDRLLEPEPVALHVAPLLRGRRAQRGRPGRLARPLAGPQRPRRQPAAGPLARHDARARARGGEHAGRRGGVADELRARHRRRRHDGAGRA